MTDLGAPPRAPRVAARAGPALDLHLPLGPAAFVREVNRLLRQKMKRELGLQSVDQAHTGAVAVVQRTDSALRLNVHLHVLVLHGTYVREPISGQLRFHALSSLTHADVALVAQRTAERVARILESRGRSLEPDHDGETSHQLELDQPGLSAC